MYVGLNAQSKIAGKMKVLLAVTETISEFNSGSASMLLKSAVIVSQENTLNALREADKERIKKAAVKITGKARHTRRKLRAKKKGSQKEKLSYLSGGFGVSKEPEIFMHEKQNRKRKLTSKSDSKKEITFVHDDDDDDDDDVDVGVVFKVDNGQL